MCFGVEERGGSWEAGGGVVESRSSEVVDRCEGRKWRRRSSQRRLESEVSSSAATGSEIEEDPLESNDDFFTGRGRPLRVDEKGVGENDLSSSDVLGLETGDSVRVARNTPLGSFEGGLSPTIKFAGVWARGGAMTSSLLDADTSLMGFLFTDPPEKKR